MYGEAHLRRLRRLAGVLLLRAFSDSGKKLNRQEMVYNEGEVEEVGEDYELVHADLFLHLETTRGAYHYHIEAAAGVPVAQKAGANR